MDAFEQIIDDVFKSTEEDYSLDLNFDDEDSSWLDSFIGDLPVLNDCMFSSGLDGELGEGTSPHIQSEHSYSLCENNGTLDGTRSVRVEIDNDLGSPMMMMVNPNLAMSADEESSSMESSTESCESSVVDIEVTLNENDVDVTSYALIEEVEDKKQEPASLPDNIAIDRTSTSYACVSGMISPTYVLAYQPTTRIITRAPTIIVTKARVPFSSGATTARNHVIGCGTPGYIARSSVSNVSISRSLNPTTTLLKPVHVVRAGIVPDNGGYASFSQEQFYADDVDSNLPPSPPSSSDGERWSPKRECSPSSPSPPGDITWSRQSEGVSIIRHSHHIASQSGRLIITEEERRTLISEGYPVPTKLPLTKQEENNLKKIQRKIKNKTSAQESRRKKKVYLDALEKQLEVSHQENGFLKKQLESLQTDNKSLLSQVQRLESLANKLRPSVETSTCVMVFALFFAMFMGSFWTPAALSAGNMASSWAGVGSSAGSLTSGSAIDSKLQNSPPILDEYKTPNIKSRMLMMMEDSVGGEDSSSTSRSSPRDSTIGWLSSVTCSQWSQAAVSTDSLSGETDLSYSSVGRPMSSQQSDRVDRSYGLMEGKNETSFDGTLTPDVAVVVYTRGPAAVNSSDIRASAV